MTALPAPTASSSSQGASSRPTRQAVNNGPRSLCERGPFVVLVRQKKKGPRVSTGPSFCSIRFLDVLRLRDDRDHDAAGAEDRVALSVNTDRYHLNGTSLHRSRRVPHEAVRV